MSSVGAAPGAVDEGPASLDENVTKQDVIEYLKAFSLVIDRDMDGIVTVAALQEFFRKTGEEVDTETAKDLIKDLQQRCGCPKEVYFSNSGRYSTRMCSHSKIVVQDLKPYLDRQTFMENMVQRMQHGLHKSTDMKVAFDLLDKDKTGHVTAEDLCEMFAVYEEPLAEHEAKVNRVSCSCAR